MKKPKRSLVFEGNTWEVYETLKTRDPRLHKSLCNILKEMLRDDPAAGIGKPELSRHNLIGFWSRRLSQKDRVIYKFDDKYVYIFLLAGITNNCNYALHRQNRH
ncbi:MAG: type II toxin-antitoxin system YoeB family toxin [Nitrosomonas sp.]|uniref:type II toxin-antitoxin system YoeB family toxin n=1 Tax=Nitrosomonas sp. TaxID=42353 RepID=UPI001D8FD8DB|nr:type II toxin-antitoxin system YoeB family toxin [Nitrosomonas sp.]MBX9895075.1 type II toxin-antitoxin system YoeB family toxin [Nitrosomonas sp.]